MMNILGLSVQRIGLIGLFGFRTSKVAVDPYFYIKLGIKEYHILVYLDQGIFFKDERISLDDLFYNIKVERVL